MDLLTIHCKALGLPSPVMEHRFHPRRRFRFDYAWPLTMLAVEQEGGIFIRGRHSRGKGMLSDMEKYNLATIMGWSILRFTPTQVQNGEAALKVKEWFDERRK
uniref:DUF559 domain-containing protein n=1 Tax=viral metagenome TaxID=1070528 RepID=A0A6M3J0A1_9ZZZZ